MDDQNEEFEAFLRQFQLRELSSPPEAVALPNRWTAQWMILAAVAAVFAVVLLSVVVRNFRGTSPSYATVEVAGDSLYKIGEKVEAGGIVRTDGSQSLVLALEDESRIEMRSQSELLLESAADGVSVRLNSGSIIVNAAKQPSRHLYVQTRDLIVSVVGTVFLVKAEKPGTWVAVLQGEVQVQQGATFKTLLSGEQAATAPSMESRSLLEEIAWSRNAAAHRALLPPSPAASPLAASVHAPEVARPQLKVTSAAGQNGPPEQPPQQPQYPAPPPQQQPPQQPQQQSETLPDGLGKKILNCACSLCQP